MKANRRVVQIVLNDLTHDARVEKEACALTQAGYQITLVGLQKGDLPEQEQRDGYEIRRIRLTSHPWRLGPLTQFVRYAEFVYRAVRLARQLEPIIYHGHTLQGLIPCWLASRRHPAPVIYDSHEYEQDRNFASGDRIPPIMRRIWAWPEKPLIGQADAVITVSQSLADALVESYQLAQQPILVLNAPPMVQGTVEPAPIRQRYHIPADWPIVIHQGGLIGGRGIGELVQSAQYLDQVAILIVGDGELRAELEALAKTVTANVRIVFTGWVTLNDLPAVTVAADLGIVLTHSTCLSYHFSLPNKLFEYMQAGLPVVASDTPEVVRVVTEHGLGEVVDPTSPPAIAQAIKSMLADQQRYDQARHNARKAAGLFNWEQESAKLLALYNRLEETGA